MKTRGHEKGRIRLELSISMMLPGLVETHEGLAPPLKWAGGKRWLVSRLYALWRVHQDKRLVEPFAGGLAIVLGLRPKRALLNDANEHLIAFYKCLQAGLDLGGLSIDLTHDRGVFYQNRDRFNRLVKEGHASSPEAAGLFYYLNRTCFNGLCRFNARGFFNVPFGKYGHIRYKTDFSEYKTALERYTFVHGLFEQIETGTDDFVYADPPYDVQFTSYSPGGFNWDHQQRLASWLASRRGPVVASNQATPRVCELYESLGFKVRKIHAPQRSRLRRK